jgi:hypothetical protein
MIIVAYKISELKDIMKTFILLLIGTIIEKGLNFLISEIIYFLTGSNSKYFDNGLIYILFSSISKIAIQGIIILLIFKFASSYKKNY